MGCLVQVRDKGDVKGTNKEKVSHFFQQFLSDFLWCFYLPFNIHLSKEKLIFCISNMNFTIHFYLV